jgi:hypothetical protein
VSGGSLDLAQSWWAMDGLPVGGRAWAMEERLERIAAAGFSAVLRRVPAGDEPWFACAVRLGLGWHGTAIVDGADEAADQARRAADLGFRSLNLQVRGAELAEERARERLGAVLAAAAGRLPLLVETHRGRLTQDPWRTARCCAAIPGLRLTLDLSHYVVAGAMDQDEPAWLEALAVLLGRAGAIHARIADGHRVQVDLAPGHPGLARFSRWWTAAMAAWRAASGQRERFLACCELGPPPYHPCDAAGRELGDRWAQALLLRDALLGCWNHAVPASA